MIYSVIVFSVFYCILMILFRYGLRNLAGPSSSIQYTVAILVPAHNEEKQLPELLKCLNSQTYPKEKMEIILIDDRSKDNTYQIMNDFAKKHSHVKLLRITSTPKVSPKKNALNLGIQNADSELILTTDADSLPGPRWVQDMVASFSPKIGMVMGYAPYRTDRRFNTLFHNILALEYFTMGAVTAASAGLGFPITCNGANLAYRKSTFLSIGGFGKTINLLSGDDDLLMQRFQRKSKERIIFSGSANTRVFNAPPENFKQFFRQRVRFTSKHLAYSKNLLILLFGIYFYYLLLLISLISACFSSGFMMLFTGMLLLKIISEFYFLIPAKRLLDSRRLLIYYPLVVIPHIFYIVIFPILGQILPKRWK